MTFTEICRHVFRQAITDYHQTDNVDSAMHNPYPEGDIKYELYTKEWIDTVQWHLEDIIRDPKIKPATSSVEVVFMLCSLMGLLLPKGVRPTCTL